MSKPQSYRQILRFKTSKPAKVNNTSPPKGGLVLTPEFIAEQKQLKQEMLSFANNLRCPICQSQLDGEVNGKRAALYCCGNPKEYTAEYTENKTLKYCSFRISYEQKAYLIVCTLSHDSLYLIKVYEIDLTISIMYQDKYSKLWLSYIGPVPLFDFPISEKDLTSELTVLAMLS